MAPKKSPVTKGKSPRKQREEERDSTPKKSKDKEVQQSGEKRKGDDTGDDDFPYFPTPPKKIGRL